jgi:hypothetical protein
VTQDTVVLSDRETCVESAGYALQIALEAYNRDRRDVKARVNMLSKLLVCVRNCHLIIYACDLALGEALFRKARKTV